MAGGTQWFHTFVGMRRWLCGVAFQQICFEVLISDMDLTHRIYRYNRNVAGKTWSITKNYPTFYLQFYKMKKIIFFFITILIADKLMAQTITPKTETENKPIILPLLE